MRWGQYYSNANVKTITTVLQQIIYCWHCATTRSDINERFFASNKRRNGKNSEGLWVEISEIFAEIRQILNLAQNFKFDFYSLDGSK